MREAELTITKQRKILGGKKGVPQKNLSGPDKKKERAGEQKGVRRRAGRSDVL